MGVNHMRVLHIIAGSLKGGAARGALWLHDALLGRGVESRILSTHADIERDDISPVLPRGGLGRFLRTLHLAVDVLPAYLYWRRDKMLFSSALWGMGIRQHPWYDWAEVIHLHWVNSGMVSLREISRFNKPLVWTLRDMWPFTGGCHYALDCDNYWSGCGCCPLLHSGSRNDLSRLNNWRKRGLPLDRIRLVAISNWLADCARNSTVFAGRPVRVIPNCVDISLFSSVGRAEARRRLGWPVEEKIILCGALGLASPWKGFDKFMEAAALLPHGYKLAVFGDTHNLSAELRGRINYDLGVLSDNVNLGLAYSAADVFAAPSLQEAFGKTLIEAMACATPVTAFAATGPADIVSHRETGYLAEAFLAEDYARGLQWCCENNRDGSLGLLARERVERCFTPAVVADAYHDFYNGIFVQNNTSVRRGDV